MKKIKQFWAELDEMTTISKRELFLGITACALAGIVFGVFFGPKKRVMIASNNGNGCACGDSEEKEEESSK